MSDETRMTEAEAAAEKQAADEPSTEEENVPQVVAEAEAVAQEQAADETPAAEESEPQVVAEAEAVAQEQAVDETPAAEESEPQVVAEAEAVAQEQAADEAPAAGAPQVPAPAALSRVEGPANFNRAKQGNQRRNPRHVGNDVRIDEIDYKNVQVLSRFVDNYGRIHNRRKTRVTAKMQRKVTRAIKRARHLALMPYTGEHIRITGRRG